MQINCRRETKEGRRGAWKNTKWTEREDNKENVLLYNMPKKNYEIQNESPNIKASRKLLEQARKC